MYPHSRYNVGLSSALDVFTKFVNSPGGVLTAGAVLAGIVWKFFERVEAVLTEQTKLEIAVWLVGVNAEARFQNGPTTFARVLDRFFGAKVVSWASFVRSAIVSVCIILALVTWKIFTSGPRYFGKTWAALPIFALFYCILPDYLSLIKTRKLLAALQPSSRGIKVGFIVLLDTYLTLSIASVAVVFGFDALDTPNPLQSILSPFAGLYDMEGVRQMTELLGWSLQLRPLTGRMPYLNPTGFWKALMAYPFLFTSIWLWLYAGSGFLIKAARRFDIGFEWFNRKFDIEKHPLQSIGLVSGAIVAVVYWTVAGISRAL